MTQANSTQNHEMKITASHWAENVWSFIPRYGGYNLLHFTCNLSFAQFFFL